MGDWILTEVKKEIEAKRAARELRNTQQVIETYVQEPPNYVLIDGALWEDGLYTAKQKGTAYRSLYRGTMGEQLDSIAPYLFSVEPDSEFEKWIKEKDPIERRVTWLHSSSNIDELRKHLRHFLRMKTEGKAFIYFRFYDPYVVSCVVPNLTAEQLSEFFKEINYLQTEDRNINDRQFFYLNAKEELIIKHESVCGQ